MKKKLFIIVLLFWLSSHGFSGIINTDSLAQSIPPSVTRSAGSFAAYLQGHLIDDMDRTKALYYWLARNISYDLKMLNESNRYESLEELVAVTLKTRKAVCQGFAEVFTTVCREMGVPAFTIQGYTKTDGKNVSGIGHAWNAALIHGKWQLFDATWGGGYLTADQYIRSFTWDYFMPAPDSLIHTHMPFDPIWELKDYPISHREFLAGKEQGTSYFNFTDSIYVYQSEGELNQAESSLRRADLMEAGIPEIAPLYRKFLSYILMVRGNYYISLFNEAVIYLHEAIDQFNEFNALRTRKIFDVQQSVNLLTDARTLTGLSAGKIQQIVPGKYVTLSEIQSFRKDIQTLNEAIEEELENLGEEY